MKKRGELSKPDLGRLLEQVLTDFPPASRTGADPVQFPRWFFDKKRHQSEIEAVAVFSAMLAYGSAAQFTKKIRETLDNCNWNFLELITGKNRENFNWPGYRLSTSSEIGAFASAMGNLIRREGSIRAVFAKGFMPGKNIQEGLSSLRNAIRDEVIKIKGDISRGTAHLLPDPASGGCAKRWHMFLRWMVRKDDGVDMGLWQEVSPASLIIPLDRHISRIARNLGLTSRASDDWQTAVEISERLKEYAPDDPIRYDFSLCHLGIAGRCTHGKDQSLCRQCILSPACRAVNNIDKQQGDK